MASQDWALMRQPGMDDWWSLTNATGRLVSRVYIQFEGAIDGKRWKEGITPGRTSVGIGRIAAGETIRIRIFRSDTVDTVTVHWRSRFKTKTEQLILN